jgi:DNA-binding winged helix-turn-helix (wHTH) protein
MPEAEAPIIIVREGQLAGQRFLFSRETLLVGRGSDCDIVLPERQVSRHHLRFVRGASGFVVEDLDSKNGTFVNGKPLKGNTRLQDGDEISVALAVKLAFIGTEATLPLTFERPHPGAGALALDENTRDVKIRGQALIPPLSFPQYRLIELLYKRNGELVTRDDIVNYVWPEDQSAGISEQAIDALVRRLRDRLNELDPAHNYIVTMRGHGFRLENPPE